MLKNLKEVKEFIVWAKSQNISKAKIGDVEFEISPLHYAQEQIDQEMKNVSSEEEDLYGMPGEKSIDSNDPATFVDELDESSKSEEDDLLMWSTNA